MPTSIFSSDRALFAGNSITSTGAGREWPLRLLRQLTAIWQNPAAPAVSGFRRPFTGTAAKDLVYYNSGVGGQVVADLNTNFATQFTVFKPSIVFVEIGVNDVPVTPQGTFQTNVNTLITNLQGLPGPPRVVFVSIMTRGEVWTSGTPNTWGPNAGAPDPIIDTFNTILQTAATGAGFGWADARAAFLVDEAINNPGKAASGNLTILTDGVHLTEHGKQVLCDTVFAQLAVGA